MTCNTGRCGVDHEYKLAACDVKQNVFAYGGPVLIRFHEEDTVTRDRYGSIKNRNRGISRKMNIYALPITFSPTTKQKSDAGIKDDTDVIIWTPMLCWDDEGFTIQDLNTIKADVIIQNETYEIVDKSLRDQFGMRFLYVVLGLKEK